MQKEILDQSLDLLQLVSSRQAHLGSIANARQYRGDEAACSSPQEQAIETMERVLVEDRATWCLTKLEPLDLLMSLVEGKARTLASAEDLQRLYDTGIRTLPFGSSDLHFFLLNDGVMEQVAA